MQMFGMLNVVFHQLYKFYSQEYGDSDDLTCVHAMEFLSTSIVKLSKQRDHLTQNPPA